MVQAAPQHDAPSPATPSLRDGPSSGPASPTHRVTDSPSQLSDRDRSLLIALANPDHDASIVLATLPPEDVGPWLNRPEIQSAIAAAFELREIRLRFKLTAATDRAIDRMTAVFDANKDLADPVQRSETRRAAIAIFRLRATDRTACLSPSSPPAFLHAVRSVRHATHRLNFPSSLLTQDSGRGSPQATRRGETQDLARSTQHAAPSTPHGPAEPPPLDTSTPQAAIAGLLAAFKQLPSDAPRAALKLVGRAIAQAIHLQPVYEERFLTHLAASPALTHRHRPITADPIKVEGPIATQRIIYTLEDGTTSAALFRAVRRDPKSWETFPTASWLIDSIIPADSS